MAGFGDLLLRARGIENPRAQLLAQMLGGGAGTAPGAGAPVPAPTAPGVATPPTDVPTPPQPQAYQSPPDLLDLYTQLTDYESRSRRIDTGLGLLGSAFAQPQNKEIVYQAMTGGGGGTESASDTLSMITGISEMRAKEAEVAQQARAEEARRAMLPAIAEKYGMSLEEASLLYDTEGLDDVMIDQNKVREAPKIDTEVITDDATGKKFLINSATGEKIQTYDTGLPPSDDATSFITDAGTGETHLVRKADGSIIKSYPTTAALTSEQKLYEASKAEGFEGSLEDWLTMDANRKKAVTNITTNVNPARVDNALVEASDAKLMGADRDAASAAVTTINNLRNAQNILQQPGGIIAGSKWSPVEYETRKIFADLFGVTDPSVINTANYGAAMGDVVRSKVKELGTGNSISNADRDYTEKTAGASGEIPSEAMPKILSIMEFGSRNEIIKYNQKIEKRLEASKDPETGKIDPRVEAALQKLPVPEVSDDWMSFVPDEDIAAIKKEIEENGELSFEDKKHIDKLYGPNAADAIVERLMNGYGT